MTKIDTDAKTPENESLLSLLTKKQTQTPYYRRLNEDIGISLYRDHLNRQKREKYIHFNEELKIKQAAAVSFLRQSTKKYLTREIEKDLDMKIDYTVGAWEKLILPQKLWTILTKLQVLQENPNTAKTQNSFRTSLWNMYLAPTFDPSNKIDGN